MWKRWSKGILIKLHQNYSMSKIHFMQLSWFRNKFCKINIKLTNIFILKSALFSEKSALFLQFCALFCWFFWGIWRTRTAEATSLSPQYKWTLRRNSWLIEKTVKHYFLTPGFLSKRNVMPQHLQVCCCTGSLAHGHPVRHSFGRVEKIRYSKVFVI